jgi:hypothetical protein
MKHNTFFRHFKLIAGLLLVVFVACLLGACGSLLRVEYQNPKYGGGAVEVTLPKQDGYAK